MLTTASLLWALLLLKFAYHAQDILCNLGNMCWLSADQTFFMKSIRSQLSNAVSRNVVWLLDQKLHCFKNKSYFSHFFQFYNNQKKLEKFIWKSWKFKYFQNLMCTSHNIGRHAIWKPWYCSLTPQNFCWHLVNTVLLTKNVFFKGNNSSKLDLQSPGLSFHNFETFIRCLEPEI